MKPMDRKIAGMIMALLVIVILFVPAYVGYEIEQRTVTHIQSIEGLYENGTVISPVEPVDKTHVESLWFGETKTGADANNDSVYVKFQGVNYVYYSNFVSYIGNDTYTVTPNYTIHSLPATYRQILIPLNITTHDMVEFDFIRLTTNSEHAWHDLIWNDGGDQWLLMDQIRNDTYMIINSVSTRGAFLTAPDGQMYLSFSGLDITDAVFNFKLEGFNLDEEHQFFWTDEHLYFGTIGIAFTVMLVCAVFTTNFVDIKFDKGPGKKRG